MSAIRNHVIGKFINLIIIRVSLSCMHHRLTGYPNEMRSTLMFYEPIIVKSYFIIFLPLFKPWLSFKQTTILGALIA